MLISLILAWLSVIFAALTAFKYIARKSGNKKLNRIFSRSHITIGVLLVISGLLHGIFAGNSAYAGITDMTVAPVLFTLNWGTACFVTAVLLGLTYVFRKRLKKHWMPLHRILTVLLIALTLIHVINVGIQLDDRIGELFASDDTSQQTQTTQSNTEITKDETASSEPVQDTQASTTETQTPVEETNNLFSGTLLKDGTYEGSANGFRGVITVSVKVIEGKVAEIDILSQSDTREYFSRAMAVIDSIINKQSLQVDAVTGATISSAGIVNAAVDALKDAVVSGELLTTEYSVQNHRPR